MHNAGKRTSTFRCTLVNVGRVYYASLVERNWVIINEG